MQTDAHPLLLISQIAKMLQVHPQTLRLYERHGLITPIRTKGNMRLYSWQDLEQMRAILYLTRTLGVNVAGVEIILSIQRKIEALRQDIDALRQSVRAQSADADTCCQRALTKAVSRTLVRVLSYPP